MLKTSYLLSAIYFFSIMLAGFYCFKRPFYNWDVLPYTALILKMDHHHQKEAHDLAYELVEKNIPAKNYRQLTDSSHIYRNRMLVDAEAFNKQLPFYAIKPLYIASSYLFYKAGMDLPQATLFPSFISYLLIGLLLFHWLKFYLRPIETFIVALLIMISSPLIEVAKTSSPDCLSALFLFGAFYFIIEKPSLRAAFIIMTLSVFARLDNILTCFIILGTITFSGKWYKKIPVKKFLLMASFLAFCYLLIGQVAKPYGWSIFFYEDFAARLHPAYGSGDHFSFRSYGRLLYEHILNGMQYSHLALFMALLFLSFNGTVPLKKLSYDQLFALLIPFILILRFILYPDISDRFYTSFYLVIIILLTKRVNPSRLSPFIK